MLTFDKLVQLTTDRLSPIDARYTVDQVRDVLIDAGIDECLRQLAPAPQGRLIVHKVQISGEKRPGTSGVGKPFSYERTLGTGLWAWVGANGSGKSTILNCILWALTGSDSGISKRIRPWIHEVIVHFSIGGQQFTSRVARTVKGGIGEGVFGGIYADFVSINEIELSAKPLISYDNRDLMREQIDLFFMQRLGISTLRWTAHSPQKDDPDLHAHSTTWRTYAHSIHIDDDSYDDLIIDVQKGYGRQDRKIMEMMLGVEPARAVAEIQVQADFAKEEFGRARSRVSGKQGTFEEQIKLLSQEVVDISRAIDLMQTQPTVVEDDAPLVAKRDQRANLLSSQNQASEELAQLERQRSDLERNILELERAKLALQEQSEVEYLVNSLAIVRCPHCESAVDEPSRLERERADHACHVCSQPLQKTRTRGDIKTLIKDRDAEIANLKALVKRAQSEIAEKSQKLTESRSASAQIGKELETQVKQARQGFTESYTSLLVRKGQLEGQIEQLKRNLSDVANEKAEVDAAAMWYTILQSAAEIADQSVFELYQAVFDELSKLVVHLGAQFGVPDLEGVIIDEKRYVKVLQGGMILSHNELARSERVKFKVAFHLGMMLLQVRAGIGKHPGFLIIDTPGTAEVNDADFVAMNRDLANLHAEYGDQVQVLVATARLEAKNHLPTEIVASVEEGEHFF